MFDMHVHIPDESLFSALGTPLLEASASYFRAEVTKKGLEEVERDLSDQGVTGYALLPVPSKWFIAEQLNKRVASYIAESEMAVGFAAVNPQLEPLKTTREALGEGLVGVKIHPTLQEIYPDDKRLYTMYHLLSENQGVVIVHTGTSGIGGGLKGGGGMKIEYSRPIYVDNVAAEFPDVNFVIAHFGWPWFNEAIAIATQKANVFLDLSGWSPKYIPSEVWSYANTLLQDRVVYGSDYPFIMPSRWAKEFESIPLKEEVKRKILFKNAQKMFHLG
jgi:predicted TIM-barrel fold metal-dependent hydrolase